MRTMAMGYGDLEEQGNDPHDEPDGQHYKGNGDENEDECIRVASLRIREIV